MVAPARSARYTGVERTVAAALAQGWRYLLSEDMQHLRVMDQMQVVNPFLVGPELLDAAP